MSTAILRLLPLVLVVACGSGNGQANVGQNPPPAPGAGAIALQGVVFKGRAPFADLKVFAVDPRTGAKLDQVAETVADADGRFATAFDGVAGPVLIEATGQFQDEATGQDLPTPAGTPLRTLANVVPGDNAVSVTGMTTLHARMVQIATADIGTHVADAIDNLATLLAFHYTLDDLFAEPAHNPASDNATKLLALNGGLSQLGADLNANPLEVAEALARDLATDFVFDGRDRGEPLFANGTPLPADAGREGFLAAMRRIAGTLSTLASTAVIIDAIDGIGTGLAVCPPPKIIEIRPATGNIGGGDTIVLFGFFGDDPANEVDVTFGGATAEVLNATTVQKNSGARAFTRLEVRLPPGTGKVDVVVFDQKGQKAVVANGFQYLEDFDFELNQGAPQKVSKAGGTPLKIEGTGLQGVDYFADPGLQQRITPLYSSNRKAEVPFPRPENNSGFIEAQKGGTLQTIVAQYVDEPVGNADELLAKIAGRWCFVAAVRLNDSIGAQKFEFVFRADGTASRQFLDEDGEPVGTPDEVEFEVTAGCKVLVPVPFILGEIEAEVAVESGGTLMMGGEQNAVYLAVKKESGFRKENLAQEWNFAGGIQLGDENGPLTAYVGSLNFNDDRTEVTGSFTRPFAGFGLEEFASDATGHGDVEFDDEGFGNVFVRARERFKADMLADPLGRFILFLICNEDEECPFRGIGMGFPKGEGLDSNDLGGTFGGGYGQFVFGDIDGGVSYAAGSPSPDSDEANTSITEYSELRKATPSTISFPLTARGAVSTWDANLTGCGRLHRFANANSGDWGMGSPDGDMFVEFLPVDMQQLRQVGVGLPFAVSFRFRVPEFHSLFTFTGEMNELEFAVDTGFGGNANDITLATRTVASREIRTNGRIVPALGVLGDEVDPRRKLVERDGSNAPTVAGDNTPRGQEVCTVIGDHLFIFPADPGGGLPVNAHGKIAANGEFAVLQAPSERHGVLFRILAKKTDAAPDLAGMTYHVGSSGVGFEGADERLLYARGTLTFNGDGTFDASVRAAVEDPDLGSTVFTNVETGGTFAVTADGRITLDFADGSQRKGMVTRGGDAIFVADTGETSPTSVFCVLVKQATQVPAFQRTVLRRAGMDVQGAFAGSGFFLSADTTDLLRSGDDVRIAEIRHSVLNNFPGGVLERFTSRGTTVLAADGVFDLTVNFAEGRGALSENGVIGFLMPGLDTPQANSLQILLGN